ncbi:MAG TPA: hypothetical protein VG326_04630 [Tepidisphaeraceae bacterium]|jgi:hypothetical protein|nr:hypothetical protein [Tepidisphaeraceae bacterium]
MSKIRDAGAKADLANDDLAAVVGDTAQEFPPPLKPRRGLFVVFAILLVLLFVGMLTMYFTTVYPNRHKPQPVETDQSAEHPAKN